MSDADDGPRWLVAHAEACLADIDELTGDAGARAVAAVEALVDLYGAALARVLDLVTHPPGGDPHAALVTDELIGHLLMAHGLAPAPPELLAPPLLPGEAPVAFLGRRDVAAVAPGALT